MKQYIGCDAHRKYSIFVSVDGNGKAGAPTRVEHDREEFRKYLRTLPPASPVAVEASGGWYWLMTEIEEAGLEPHLVHAAEAKRRMRGRNKTDELDAKGLAMLLYDKRLPEVWIPSAKLLDLRGLMRTRLSTRGYQTAVKNRILAAVNRYGLRGNDGSNKDWFSGKGRLQLNTWIMGLPEQTRVAAIEEWRLVDEMEETIKNLEKQIAEKISKIGYVRLLETLPGVGKILGATLYLEIGDVKRFPTAGHLASYAGLVSRVYSSGGNTTYGPVAKDANQYLKWAFVEAANCTVMHSWKYENCHVGRLYRRLQGKGHSKAAVAVARHLAEASWWILRKAQGYREPAPAATSSSENG